MLQDIRAIVGRQVPIDFLGRMGGIIPMPEEVELRCRNLMAKLATPTVSAQQPVLEGNNGRLSRN
jgi:hypothetical protein